ncbi:hypothetical protein ABBQ32_011769 [Trebouxia sp. C0010 RCD-2024]
MKKLFSGDQLHLIDHIALLAGRKLDLVYASLVHQLRLSPGFFRQGWGDLGVVNFEEDAKLFQCWPPAHFDQQLNWTKIDESKLWGVECEKYQVSFRTPCHGRVYDALPSESRVAHAQLLQPKDPKRRKACVLHLAGTGDHTWNRRMNLGGPLVQKGIATMVLESPFYGSRKPHYQFASQLLKVSDLLTLGRATVEESLCLLDWAGRHAFASLGMCGFSMGGVHASMVASLYPGNVACTPLLAPRSASGAFCHGALRSATSWAPLAAVVDEKQKEIETTLMQSARSTKGLIEAARILSTLKKANSQSQSNSAHASNAAFVNGIAQNAKQRVQESSDRHQAGSDRHTGTANHRQKAGIDAAEDELGELWRLRQGLAEDQACLRLHQVLETYTDVTRFQPPRCTRAAVLVGATEDAYVSAQSVQELAAHWPDSEVRWVKGGHVSAFLLQQPAFRQAITDSVDRLDECKSGTSE